MSYTIQNEFIPRMHICIKGKEGCMRQNVENVRFLCYSTMERSKTLQKHVKAFVVLLKQLGESCVCMYACVCLLPNVTKDPNDVLISFRLLFVAF